MTSPSSSWVFFSRAVLTLHRGDGPRDQLGGREQPTHLPEDEALHLAGGDRAHRAGVVAPAARPEADVVAIQPAAPAGVGRRHSWRFEGVATLILLRWAVAYSG
jgi:hypothetical protein